MINRKCTVTRRCIGTESKVDTLSMADTLLALSAYHPVVDGSYDYLADMLLEGAVLKSMMFSYSCDT